MTWWVNSWLIRVQSKSLWDHPPITCSFCFEREKEKVNGLTNFNWTTSEQCRVSFYRLLPASIETQRRGFATECSRKNNAAPRIMRGTALNLQFNRPYAVDRADRYSNPVLVYRAVIPQNWRRERRRRAGEFADNKFLIDRSFSFAIVPFTGCESARKKLGGILSLALWNAKFFWCVHHRFFFFIVV